MFGKRLRILREKRGLTQAEVANLFNISTSTIGMYEQGRRDPDTAVLKKIADYFDVSADYLLGRTDDPGPHPKIETIAAHRTDDPMDELPEEARKSVEEFLEYIHKKYGRKKENGE